MAIIQARGLCKEFQIAIKRPGLAGSIKALVAPEIRHLRAVDNIDLVVEEGATLAFIGPNGAGKSTTIKMLTGILHPSSGEATVSGFVPWKDRMALARKIGCVFGQRSQLWYHLPPADSFLVLGRIFDLPDREVAERTAELTERLELGEFLHTPVRKLSLGQRMRCEIAACLLHRPRVLFLDEPTIGLDVVAKRAIRELIQKLNKEEGVTVFLTSHDAGDIESLCRRVVIVNHGVIVLDLPVKELKHRFFARKSVGVRYDEAPPEALLPCPGVELIKRKGAGLKFRVDTGEIPIGRALAHIADIGRVVDINVADPPLEEVIAEVYGAENEDGE